jgi:FkbM family methyltransferase
MLRSAHTSTRIVMIAFHGTFSSSDLEATLGGLPRGSFFVQVGAMDGLAHDPVHKFVKEKAWRGLLIEPMPDMFARLQKNYEGCKGLTFINKAVTDFEGQIEMTRIDPAVAQQQNLTDWTQGISTLMPDRGMLGGATQNRDVDFETKLKPFRQKIDVPCARLTTLLDQYKVSNIDCLIIDTEGADWMVARQLPLDRIRPRVVYLEYLHLSAYEKTACASHFTNHGYRIYLEHPTQENFLAIRSGEAA